MGGRRIAVALKMVSNRGAGFFYVARPQAFRLALTSDVVQEHGCDSGVSFKSRSESLSFAKGREMRDEWLIRKPGGACDGAKCSC